MDDGVSIGTCVSAVDKGPDLKEGIYTVARQLLIILLNSYCRLVTQDLAFCEV